MVIKWNIHENVSNNLENEIVAALAVSDMTHSKLKATIPERGSRSFVDDKTFDSILEKVCIIGFEILRYCDSIVRYSFFLKKN